jgi:hypothetical protein
MITPIVLTSLLAFGEVHSACLMRAVPLDDVYREVSRKAISVVMSDDKKMVNALLKNGDALRIISMGCQHSVITARLWTQGYATPDNASLIGSFSEIAELSLPENDARDFIDWLKDAAPDNAKGSSQIAFTGQDLSRLITFEAAFARDSFGSTLDITFEFQ